MGDILRSTVDGNRKVSVNTRFTKLNGYEYMRARKIFLENEKINALPIVDSENQLIGAYSRWDDMLDISVLENYRIEEYMKFLKEKIKRAAFVDGGVWIPKKKKIIELARCYFEKYGIKTEQVSYQDVIGASDKNDIILFSDEDEFRGIETLYWDILGKKLKNGCTLISILERYDEEYKKKQSDLIVDNVMNKLSNAGVRIMICQNRDNGSKYRKELHDSLNERWRSLNLELKTRTWSVPEEIWEEFFDEMYSYEYAKAISSIKFEMIRSGSVVRLKDAETNLYQVKDGERRTIGQPQEYKKTIYFYGRCPFIGVYVEDAHTIESYLQNFINGDGYKVKVVNYSGIQDNLSILYKICTTQYKVGDIVIVYWSEDKTFDKIASLNLTDCLESKNVPAKWLLDELHCNYKVNEIYAKGIYAFIEKWLDEKETEKLADKVEVSKELLINIYLERYFSDYSPKGSVGAIVMNCNPFTIGHRYLIEEALMQVDNLIIFVVEEDRSLFTFRERYAMVREGTKDLKNIKIVPSGNFILSQTTFPEYFLKIEDEDLEANVECDITLFAESIAPRLNITYRFVGEEEFDQVTNVYNRAMKRILPKYGVKVVEIPRKNMVNGEPISATEVRKRLKMQPFGDLSDLIPESTEKLLVQSWE